MSEDLKKEDFLHSNQAKKILAKVFADGCVFGIFFGFFLGFVIAKAVYQ